MATSPKAASPTDEHRPRFSFEDQLTFAPKLNALSMRMANVNRTSIIHRKKQNKKSMDHLSEQLFRPTVSDNSTKIVAKMKTGFWERQEKHVKHQQEMFDLGPSTIHPNLRTTASKSIEKHSKSSMSPVKVPSQTSKSKSKSIPECSNNEETFPNGVNSTIIVSKCVDKNENNNDNNKNNEIDNTNEKCSTFILNNGRDSVHAKNQPSFVAGKGKFISKNVERNKVMISPRKVAKHSKGFENNTIKDAKGFENIKTKNAKDFEKIKTEDIKDFENIKTKDAKDFESIKNKHEIKEKCEIDSKPKVVRRLFDGDKNENILTDWKEGQLGGPENEALNKCKKKHKRHQTYPLTQDQMDENYQRMRKLKKAAEKAIKNKKIFLCHGPYHTVRSSLRRRGWIEKYLKNDGMLRQNLLNDGSDLKQDDTQELDLLRDDHYGIMSRMIRNSTPSFIWTLRRDDIDFQFLQKDQMVNHFVCAWTFTTKAGLCLNLRNVHYYQNIHSNSFFPRCYRLCCDEEKEEFIDDYRMTAALSILKLVVLKHDLWKAKEEANHISEESSGHDTKAENAKTKRPNILPTNALALAMKACYSYLDTQQHLDIEETYVKKERDLDESTWRTIISYYYQILNHNAVISNASSNLSACQDILSQMSNHFLQMNIDGHRNLWILKPGAKSRGRGIELKSQLDDILNTTSDNVSKKENRWVIQKYIEQPLLIYRTKFDIRQWFLVTDWNPLVLWFYKDCYIRFCGQEFTFDNLGPQYHLSNNSVQKHYPIGKRSEHLPDSNMWSSDEFKEYLIKKGHKSAWDHIIYDGMKKAIIAVLQACQNSLDYRKNSFELYGADFMLSEDLKPWLIEINSSPALGASTDVTERLCRNVIDDTMKVVLDRHENKQCDVGRYELAFKQPHIPIPTYMGCKLSVDGLAIKNTAINHPTKQKVKPIECKLKMGSKSISDDVKCNSPPENHPHGEIENNVKESQVKCTLSDDQGEHMMKSCSDTSVTSSNALSVTSLLPNRKLSDSKLSNSAVALIAPSPEFAFEGDHFQRSCYNCSRCSSNDECTVDVPSDIVESYDVRCLGILKRAAPLTSRLHRSKRLIVRKPTVLRYKNQFGILASQEMGGINRY